MDANAAQREVYLHIAELAKIIDDLKKQISSHGPQYVKNTHIPEATDELDAVVAATAEATNTIMAQCEKIDTVGAGLDEASREALTGCVTQIYEACSFQDITGQRIKKVISTLRVIEERVDSIVDTLGDKVGLKISDAQLVKEVSVEDEKSLLNGPQMPDKAITQDDIDKLLAEFDN
jgi:chemotaxis protein CheZ